MADLEKVQSKNDTVIESKLVWTEVFQQEGTSSNNVAVIKDISDYIKKLNNDLNPDLKARAEIVGGARSTTAGLAPHSRIILDQ